MFEETMFVEQVKEKGLPGAGRWVEVEWCRHGIDVWCADELSELLCRVSGSHLEVLATLKDGSVEAMLFPPPWRFRLKPAVAPQAKTGAPAPAKTVAPAPPTWGALRVEPLAQGWCVYAPEGGELARILPAVSSLLGGGWVVRLNLPHIPPLVYGSTPQGAVDRAIAVLCDQLLVLCEQLQGEQSYRRVVRPAAR